MTQVNINLDCKCPADCPRHGKCDECKTHHSKIGSKPYCMRCGED